MKRTLCMPPNVAEKYEKNRRSTEEFFRDTSLVPDQKNGTITLPEGNYRLLRPSYATKPGCWSFTRGIIVRNSDDRVVADVKRNYSSFWHAWFKRSGREYLLCGEDYQGYSCVDLEASETAVYFPRAGFKGHGFCWADVTPSPSGNRIVVHGCYWAAPYEIRAYDVSDPMRLPYPEVASFDGVIGDGQVQNVRWSGDDALIARVEVITYGPNRKKWMDLTPEELRELKEDPGGYTNDDDPDEEVRLEIPKEPMVVSVPDVCGGEPVIAGTRITARHIFELVVKLGWKWDKVQAEYPHLTMDQISAAYRHVEERADLGEPGE